MTSMNAALRALPLAACGALVAGAAPAQTDERALYDEPQWFEERVCTERPIIGDAIATSRRRAENNALREWEEKATDALLVKLERRFGARDVRIGRDYEIEVLLLRSDAVLFGEIEQVGGVMRCEGEQELFLQFECQLVAGACASYAVRAEGSELDARSERVEGVLGE